MPTIIKAFIGALLGFVLGAVMIYGLVEVADWIVEHT